MSGAGGSFGNFGGGGSSGGGFSGGGGGGGSWAFGGGANGIGGVGGHGGLFGGGTTSTGAPRIIPNAGIVPPRPIMPLGGMGSLGRMPGMGGIAPSMGSLGGMGMGGSMMPPMARPQFQPMQLGAGVNNPIIPGPAQASPLPSPAQAPTDPMAQAITQARQQTAQLMRSPSVQHLLNNNTYVQKMYEGMPDIASKMDVLKSAHLAGQSFGFAPSSPNQISQKPPSMTLADNSSSNIMSNNSVEPDRGSFLGGDVSNNRYFLHPSAPWNSQPQMPPSVPATNGQKVSIVAPSPDISGLSQVPSIGYSAENLQKQFPNAQSQYLNEINNSGPILDQYGINTPQRKAAFFGQLAHESGGFKYGEELGNKDYFSKYDYKLGNNGAGDGWLYRGRGLIQLTGKANYAEMGNKLGLDLVNHPELASQPDVAMKIAAQYWSDHHLNTLADQNNIKAITKAINGGYNGLSERQKYTNLFLSMGQ